MTRSPLNNVPLLGQAQAQAKAGIMQAVNGLSMAIYTRVAASAIGSSAEAHMTAENIDMLRAWAQESHAAAQAYFEGLGIAQFSGPDAKQQQGKEGKGE